MFFIHCLKFFHVLSFEQYYESMISASRLASDVYAMHESIIVVIVSTCIDCVVTS